MAQKDSNKDAKAKPLDEEKEPVERVDEEIEEEQDDEVLSYEEMEAALKEAEEKLEEEKHKTEELISVYKVVQADFDNFRKRTAENMKKIRDETTCEVMEKILPALDIIDNAVSMIKDSQVLSGLKMMRNQLWEIFRLYNVEEIESVDMEFDPNLHNAVLSVDDAENAGKIVEVLQKGYKINDKVIRYASVKVAN